MMEKKAALAFVETETPGRKRKRETNAAQQPLSEKELQAAAQAAASASCFSNAAFSSTPKKLVGRRRIAKENTNPFASHACLEVKSIEDLAAKPAANPFEVVRQPQKKKKREHACFENPGLNLELPEKQFNPFEVVRTVATPAQCFVNAALNLRGNDAPASLNPYEIHRTSEISAAAANRAGVQNHALAEEPLPTDLKIGLPFTPTLGCRIDFKGLSLSQLTPSKLLAEKLVLSPVAAPKRSLGAISEETTMDIGKELDRYQLELENSINEAKLRKNGVVVETETQTLVVLEQKQQVDKNMELERRVVCTRRSTLTKISEVPEQQDAQPPQAALDAVAADAELQPVEPEPEPGDVAYASDSEDELEFKAPVRFVRAYRPAGSVGSTDKLKTVSKESLHSIASSKSNKSAETKSGSTVTHLIRKSIRKLMHPMQQQQQQQHNQSNGSTEQPPPPAASHHNIMSSIRHSLRRRTHKAAQAPEQSPATADISIIDSSERTMKLRSCEPQTDYMRIEQLTNERKHSLRNSIRQSTRALRHAFHKTQNYATAK